MDAIITFFTSHNFSNLSSRDGSNPVWIFMRLAWLVTIYVYSQVLVQFEFILWYFFKCWSNYNTKTQSPDVYPGRKHQDSIVCVLTMMMMENIKVEAGENDWSLFCFYK